MYTLIHTYLATHNTHTHTHSHTHTHTHTHTDGRAARAHTFRHGAIKIGMREPGHTHGTPGAARAAAVTTATFFTTAS